AGLAAGLGIAALMSHLGLGAEFGNILMMVLIGVVAIVAIRFLLRRFGPNPAATRTPQGLQFAGAGAGATPAATGGSGWGAPAAAPQAGAQPGAQAGEAAGGHGRGRRKLARTRPQPPRQVRRPATCRPASIPPASNAS